MKQALLLHITACFKRMKRSWTNNWFSYTLLIIVLLAIWKKHHHQWQSLLDVKPAQVSNLGMLIQQDKPVPELNQEHVTTFIKRFERTARQEEKKYKIPARIILAVALVQSEAGTSDFALKTNNFFAMRNGNALGRYATAWESFRAFSLTVKTSLAGRMPVTDQDWIEWLAQCNWLETGPQFDVRVRQYLP